MESLYVFRNPFNEYVSNSDSLKLGFRCTRRLELRIPWPILDWLLLFGTPLSPQGPYHISVHTVPLNVTYRICSKVYCFVAAFGNNYPRCSER